MTTFTEQQELLSLRFLGDDLSTKSLPIYDLGTSFIAIQRMLYKARQHELGTEQSLSAQEKNELTLQVKSHTKGSDAWALAPYNFSSNGYLTKTVTTVWDALAMYVNRLIGQPDPSGSASQLELLGLSIYTDTKTLVDRIDGNTISEIEFNTPSDSYNRPLAFDLRLKDFVHSLREQSIVGPMQELTGVLSKLDFDRAVAALHVGPRHHVRVQFDDLGIDRLRREAPKNSRVTIEGTPIYRFGVSPGKFDRFEAREIIRIDTD